jgi:hypothetical protein
VPRPALRCGLASKSLGEHNSRTGILGGLKVGWSGRLLT